MKTILIAASIAAFSSAALAQQAPQNVGDYSASVENQLDTQPDNGMFRLNFSGQASALNPNNLGNYSANVKASDIYGGK